MLPGGSPSRSRFQCLGAFRFRKNIRFQNTCGAAASYCTPWRILLETGVQFKVACRPPPPPNIFFPLLRPKWSAPLSSSAFLGPSSHISPSPPCMLIHALHPSLSISPFHVFQHTSTNRCSDSWRIHRSCTMKRHSITYFVDQYSKCCPWSSPNPPRQDDLWILGTSLARKSCICSQGSPGSPLPVQPWSGTSSMGNSQGARQPLPVVDRIVQPGGVPQPTPPSNHAPPVRPSFMLCKQEPRGCWDRIANHPPDSKPVRSIPYVWYDAQRQRASTK